MKRRLAGAIISFTAGIAILISIVHGLIQDEHQLQHEHAQQNAQAKQSATNP